MGQFYQCKSPCVVTVWLYRLSHGTVGTLQPVETNIPGLSTGVSH